MRKKGIVFALGLHASCLVAQKGNETFGTMGHVDEHYLHVDNSTSPLAPKNIGNEVIYQIMVDRFFNGNTANDCLYEGKFCVNGGENDWYRYMGGDLRGIIQKLSYLKQLGVTRLWLTPIFENQMLTVRDRHTNYHHEVTSYHGYWIRDWFQLNPIFTDHGKQDFNILRELLNKALPEIKIYLDTVANHTSPLDATPWSLDYLNAIEPLETNPRVPMTHRGALFKSGSYLTSYDEDVFHARNSPDQYEPFFHQSNRRIGDEEGDWENEERVQNFNLEHLADLNQNNPLVDSYLLSAHKFWKENFPALAGYRMDTIKHIHNDYWEKFSRELYAGAGTSQLEIFGEYYGGGPMHASSAEFYKNTQMSMIDFNFRDALRKVFLFAGSFSLLTDVWEQDRELVDARYLITYLDSHDQKRLRGDSPPISFKNLQQALTLLLTARGIPCIYYGLEQDLFVSNEGGDPYNRPFMRSFDEQHPNFVLLKKLIALRKDNLAARMGSTHVIHKTQHILGFERVYGDEMIFVAMSKNPIVGSDNFEMQGSLLPNGNYRDVLSNRVYSVRGGKIPVTLRDGDIVVLATGSRS